MRSYQVTEFGSALSEATRTPPEPTGTEVLLQVAACGVCHSDVHLREGYFDLGAEGRLDLSRGLPLPFTLGHEVAGDVVAMGPEAAAGPDAVAVGDRRVVYPWIGCGQCAQCAEGREHLCRAPRNIGIQCDGGYSDHVLVPHPRYLVPFGDIPVEEACTYACSGLTAYSALRKVGPLAAGDPLVVIGAGGVGLAGVRLADHVTGVAPIVAEIDGARRDAAISAGACDAIDPAEEGAARAMIKATKGGVAAAVDFVGSAESARFGFDILRKGGKLVIVGLFGGGLSLPVPHFPLREVVVAGSYVGTLDELRELLVLAREGKVGRAQVTARPLDDAEAALSELQAGRVTGRAVLVP
jgi:D-arabinose 1-dehydrogenase-like Zn-dependent alcohol dehydrogenase